MVANSKASDLRGRDSPLNRREGSETHDLSRVNREQLFALLLTLSFGIICLITILRHEMWRDEIDAFITSRDSSSFANLIHNARFSGHPGLWYVFVYGITRFTHNPMAMQFLNLGFAIGTVYVFSRFSPFSRWVKLLFAFGYFPLYEYGTISREYCLGVLLVFLLCAIYQRRPHALFLIVTVLILMSFTTIYTFILALAFGLCLIGRFIWDKSYRSMVLLRPLLNGAAVCVVVVAMVLLMLLLRPPAGGRVYHGLNTKLSSAQIEGVLDEIWNAYLPLPKLQREFWNTNLITDHLGPQPLLDLMLMAGVVYLLFRSRFALSFFWIGTGGLLLFSYLVYHGYLRHHGFLFILLLCSLWISNVTSKRPSPRKAHSSPPKQKSSRARSRVQGGTRPHRRTQFQMVALVILLVVHCVAGAFACVTDWLYPFSCSRLAADYILQHKLEGTTIVARVDLRCFSICAWIEEKIYFADSLEYGTYVRYDKPATFVTNETAASMAQIAADRTRKEVVLVLTDDPPFPSPAGFVENHIGRWNIREVANFTESIVSDEHFWVYLVSPRQLEGTAE